MSSATPATEKHFFCWEIQHSAFIRAIGVTGHPPERVHNPERQEQGIKQDHNPRCQENRLWPIQGSAWKNPMGPGQKRGPAELADLQGSPCQSSVLTGE